MFGCEYCHRDKSTSRARHILQSLSFPCPQEEKAGKQRRHDKLNPERGGHHRHVQQRRLDHKELAGIVNRFAQQDGCECGEKLGSESPQEKLQEEHIDHEFTAHQQTLREDGMCSHRKRENRQSGGRKVRVEKAPRDNEAEENRNSHRLKDIERDARQMRKRRNKVHKREQRQIRKAADSRLTSVE